METVTLKLDPRHIQQLKDQAEASGRSKAAVVRDLIDRHLGRRRRSLHDQAKDLCGSIAGAKDMSTRTLNKDFLVYRRKGRHVIALLAPFM